MVELKIQVSKGVLASLRKAPDEFCRDMRLTAAIKWYELRQVSQGRAAEIAGLTRSEFIDALGKNGVTPFQYDADEIEQEALRE